MSPLGLASGLCVRACVPERFIYGTTALTLPLAAPPSKQNHRTSGQSAVNASAPRPMRAGGRRQQKALVLARVRASAMGSIRQPALERTGCASCNSEVLGGEVKSPARGGSSSEFPIISFDPVIILNENRCVNVVCKEWLALLRWPGTMGVCETQATCWVHTLSVDFSSLGEKAVTLEMRSSNDLTKDHYLTKHA